MTQGAQSDPGISGRLGTQTIYALLGNAFTFAIGLPLQIYVSRTLGAGGLGVYAIIDGVIFTAAGFLGLGVGQTVVRYLPEHLAKHEYTSVRRMLWLGTIILLAFGGIAYIALLVALPFLNRFWPVLAGYSHLFALMGLTLPLGLLAYFVQQGLRGFQEIRHVIFGSSILQLSVKAGATCIAFAFGLRLEGYALATVLGILAGVLWMTWGLKRKLDQLPGDGQESLIPPFRAWQRYAAISYSASILGVASARLDRFILGAFVDVSTVGVLLVVYQLQQLPQIFNTMLLMVGAPMLSAAHSRDATLERQHLFVLMTDWSVKASLPLVLFLSLFAHPVLDLFGPGFADGGAAALWLLLFAQAFSLAVGPVGNVALMSGLEHIALRLDALNTTLMAVLTISLALSFGLLGVAIATVSTTVFKNSVYMILVKRRLGLRWWNRRYLSWLAPTAITGGIGVIILCAGATRGSISLALTLIVMYFSFALVLYVQGFHSDERDLLRAIAGRFRLRPAE